MRVLVTGGAGFIGSHVVDLLAARGHEVAVVDSLHPRAHAGRPDYLRADVAYVAAELEAGGPALARAVAWADAVCHQAAMVGLGVGLGDVTAYVRANDLGTAALLAAVHSHGRRVGRLVMGQLDGRLRRGRLPLPA